MFAFWNTHWRVGYRSVRWRISVWEPQASLCLHRNHNSENSAISAFSSCRLFHWVTVLPLNLRSLSPSGKTRFPFQRISQTLYPHELSFQLSWLFRRRLSIPIRSRDVSSFQAVFLTNVSHPTSGACCALGLALISFFPTGLATKVFTARSPGAFSMAGFTGKSERTWFLFLGQIYRL